MNATESSQALYIREQSRIRELLERLWVALEAHSARQASTDDLGPAGDLARAAADLQHALNELTP